ncbi:MAG: hypothetical protein QOG00_396, partial [Pyrinomonadaceae bacterium]|nr:hypothetical protein [Pyrinomonadaceae bacterium]
YRHTDSRSITNHSYAHMRQRFGDKILMDVFTSEFGCYINEQLDLILRECPVLIVIIGKRWLSTINARGKQRLGEPDYVRWEVEYGLSRNITVIPVLVEGAKVPPKGRLPESLWKLTGRVGIEVRSGTDFEHDIARLVATLEKILYGKLRRTCRHIYFTFGKPMAEFIGWSIISLTVLALSGLLIWLLTSQLGKGIKPLDLLKPTSPVKPAQPSLHIPARQRASQIFP